MEETSGESKKEQKTNVLKNVVIKGTASVYFFKDIIASDECIHMKIVDEDTIVIENIDYDTTLTKETDEESVVITDKKITINNLQNKRIIIEGYDMTDVIDKVLIKQKRKRALVKSYDVSMYTIEICKIDSSNTSSIKIAPEIINKEEIRIITTGDSVVTINELKCKLGVITSAGESFVRGSMKFDNADLFSSGLSKIEGITCTESADIVSKGLSKISITASKECRIVKDQSDNGTIKISE